MGAYILRRCLLLVPTVFGLTVLAFALGRFSGDPAGVLLRQTLEREPTADEVASARRALGLDRPLPAQYASWAGRAVQGDLGTSYSRGTDVTDELGQRLVNTLRLAVPAAALVLVLGVPLGVVCAAHRNRVVDQVLRVVSLVGASMPSYWTAFLLIQLLAVRLQLTAAGGSGGIRALVLPVLALTVGPVAVLTRFTRSAMIDALGNDYVRTASAKGVPWQVVVERHALRNSLLPVATVFGGIFGGMVAGAAILETIFARAGLGTMALTAIREQDFPVLQGFVLFTGVLFVSLNLLIDLSYTVIDPRVRLGGAQVAR